MARLHSGHEPVRSGKRQKRLLEKGASSGAPPRVHASATMWSKKPQPNQTSGANVKKIPQPMKDNASTDQWMKFRWPKSVNRSLLAARTNTSRRTRGPNTTTLADYRL